MKHPHLLLLCIIFFFSFSHAQTLQPKTRLDFILEELKSDPNMPAQQFDQKIKEANQLATHDTLKAKVYLSEARWYKANGDFHSSGKHFSQAQYYALKARNYSLSTNILYERGHLLIAQGLSDSCINLLQSYTRVIQAGNTIVQSKILTLYGDIHFQKGDLKASIDANQKALELSSQNKDTAVMLKCYSNIGRSQENPDSAIFWLRKVLDYPQPAYKLMYATTLYMIGFSYFQRDDVLRDSALYYFLETNKHIDDLANNALKAQVGNAIGSFFVAKEEYKLALPYLYQSLSYGKNFSNPTIDLTIHSIAHCHFGLFHIDSATYYLTLYKQRAATRNDDYEQMLYYELAANIEGIKSGDSCSLKVFELNQQALFHAKQIEESRIGYITLSKQINCITVSPEGKIPLKYTEELLGYCAFFKPIINQDFLMDKYAGFLFQYSVLAKRAGNYTLCISLLEELNDQQLKMRDENYTRGQNEALIKYKADLNGAEIAYRKRVNLFLIGGVVLLIVIIVITVFYYIKTKTLNTFINAQKAEVENINKVKDRIFGVISHDLRAPLNSLVSYLDLTSIENYPAQKLLSHNVLLKKQLFTTTEMMSNLLNWAHSQMQGYKPILETIELKPIVDQLIESFYTEATAKNVRIQNNIPEQVFVHADINMTTLIIRNLLSNAIKFTAPASMVSIDVSQKNSITSITVKDEGAGLSDDWLQTFNLATNDTFMPSTPGSQNEKGIGIGLMLSKNFAQLMGGTLTAHNNPPKGAIFTVHLV